MRRREAKGLGCAQVAVFFVRYRDPFRRGFSVAAHCEAHAKDTAKRLSYPWPISERNAARFPVQRETTGQAGLEASP